MRALLVAATLLTFAGASQAAEAIPPAPNDAQGGGSLSEKLSDTNGVITPKTDVDPGIATPPPPTGGKMPVIPPPGTGGGQPSVQPK